MLLKTRESAPHHLKFDNRSTTKGSQLRLAGRQWCRWRIAPPKIEPVTKVTPHEADKVSNRSTEEDGLRITTSTATGGICSCKRREGQGVIASSQADLEFTTPEKVNTKVSSPETSKDGVVAHATGAEGQRVVSQHRINGGCWKWPQRTPCCRHQHRRKHQLLQPCWRTAARQIRHHRSQSRCCSHQLQSSGCR